MKPGLLLLRCVESQLRLQKRNVFGRPNAQLTRLGALRFWERRVGCAESGIKEKFDSRRGVMMLDLRQVFSLTDFLRHHKDHVARLEETGKPVVLTVKGKPALVIQGAESYQALLDRLERAEMAKELGTGEGI